jgi:uncharacterized protein
MNARALVLCDDAWHPASLVEQGLGALPKGPIDFTFLTRGDHWSPSMLKDFSIVLIVKANHLGATDRSPWLTQKTQSALRSFVRAGGGLFLIHGGVCYGELPEMCGLAGGTFLSHPDQCLVTIEPKAGHPLATNARTFNEMDEHYFVTLEVMDADIFLRTRSKHGTQPAGWIRTEGEGRVCAMTPGHNLAVWSNREYRTLIRNGLLWLAKLA